MNENLSFATKKHIINIPFTTYFNKFKKNEYPCSYSNLAIFTYFNTFRNRFLFF